MSSIGTGYDLSASQFSPDGRVFQVEYAQKAVENSGTAIGIRGKDGVVFGVEKLITSKLYEKGDNKRILNIDKHVGMYTVKQQNYQGVNCCIDELGALYTKDGRTSWGESSQSAGWEAVAGLNADARHLVERAREEASNYRHSYGDSVPLKYLTERVAGYVHAHTLYSSVRPFGVSLIIGSMEQDGPQMFLVEPSGVSFGYHGCAIGKAKQNAKTEIEKLKVKDMPIRDLVKEVAKIIYIVHDEVKDKSFELELSWVGNMTKGKHELVPPEVLLEAEKYAKEALEESDDSDEEDL